MEQVTVGYQINFCYQKNMNPEVKLLILQRTILSQEMKFFVEEINSFKTIITTVVNLESKNFIYGLENRTVLTKSDSKGTLFDQRICKKFYFLTQYVLSLFKSGTERFIRENFKSILSKKQSEDPQNQHIFIKIRLIYNTYGTIHYLANSQKQKLRVKEERMQNYLYQVYSFHLRV